MVWFNDKHTIYRLQLEISYRGRLGELQAGRSQWNAAKAGTCLTTHGSRIWGISFYEKFLYKTQKYSVTLTGVTNNYCEQNLYREQIN